MNVSISVRDGRFGSKVGQIGPKWDKSGTFSDQTSVHFSGRNGVMVSASDCHPKDRSSIPGQDTLVSTAVSQGESI